MINELHRRLAESDADRQARLEVINELHRRLAESDADRQAQQAELRQRDADLGSARASAAGLEGQLTQINQHRTVRLLRAVSLLPPASSKTP